MTPLWLYLAVMVGMAALDFVYAEYMRTTADKRAVAAANWSVILILISGFVTTSYVKDPTLLVPAAFGAWAGTYTSVWRHK